MLQSHCGPGVISFCTFPFAFDKTATWVAFSLTGASLEAVANEYAKDTWKRGGG